PLHEWFSQRTRLRSGAAGAGGSAAGEARAGGAGATSLEGGAGASSLGDAGVLAGAGGTQGAGAPGPGGARTRGTGAARAGGVGGAGAGGAGVGNPGTGGVGTGGTGAGGAGAGGTGTIDPGARGTGAAGASGVGSAGGGCAGAGGTGVGGTSTGGAGAGGAGAGDPGAGDSLTERRKPESCLASPVRAVHTGRRVPRPRPQPVPGTHAMALRPSSVPLRVPLPPPPKSSLPAVLDPESDLARAASPTVSRLLATVVTGPSFESTTASALVAELVDFAAACRLDYATSLVAESDSDCPPSVGGECALGTDVLEDRREDFECLAATTFFQTFSPNLKMTTLRVLLHVAAQRVYELHSLEFSTAFLQGSLHEEIWLRRPPGFTGSFPADTQWSLRWPVYGLRQAPREWHNTVRTTLAALGFAPSIADPSLFLRTDTLLPPFYVLVYVDNLIFATADTKALALVMRSCRRDTPALTWVLQRFGFRYSSPHTSGMGLLLGGWGPVVLTGHADASWVDDLATQRSSQGYTFSLGSGSVSWRSTRSASVLSSSCEAEIYPGAMAAQELRWLTYLLTNLGERPRSSSVLYVDNKAMIALCQEHRLEHKMKHIALCYFLA
ncbi:unnamed protein product, partial [Closterium sp. NIES-53]